MKELKKNEKKVIKQLRRGKKKIKEVAEAENLPISTTFDIMKRLEEKGIITHQTIINFEKIGYPLRAHFKIRTRKKEEVKEFLRKEPRINNLYQLSDEELYFEALFKNREEAEKFKEELEKRPIIEHETYHYVEPIIKEEFLTKEEHFR